jgi:hypothetical protein
MKRYAFFLLTSLFAFACVVPWGGGGTFYRDDFSSDDSGWGVGTDADSSVEYVEGGLRMVTFAPRMISWSTAGVEALSDVHIEAMAVNRSVDPGASFGIVCNAQDDDSFYFFEVGGNGYYAIARYPAAADAPIYLIKGQSDIVKSAGTVLNLGADCAKDGSLVLYVNGAFIASANDTNAVSGYVGLFASSYEQPSGADVTFDDFVIASLGGSSR